MTVEDWAEIRRLHRAETKAIKAIVRERGISRNAVREALARDDPPSADTVIVADTTEAGRLLVVVTADDRGRAFVVTAQGMSASEKRAYRRRMR